ncbi:MAG TPA: DUF3047 domain-containing protein [Spirochaetota bacterium]|mgnify:CR=1 FL=1|nr:DUF3047 domain-containing protein [Spirochaetota bacterium]
MQRFLLTIILLLYVMVRPVMHDSMYLHSAQGYLMLEDFQGYGSSPFPAWESTKPYDQVARIYSVLVEGDRKFLRASTLELNKMIQIGRPIKKIKFTGPDNYWDIYKYPCIQWDWRVHTIPKGADERIGNVNDSAASIYVVFPRKNLPVLDWENQPADWFKYVWSSTLPVGTVVQKHVKKYGVTLYKGKTIVVASGSSNLKKWVTFKRNVLADYRTYFGKEPKYHPSVIGILTDSNSTKSSAMADYDNIMVLTD